MFKRDAENFKSLCLYRYMYIKDIYCFLTNVFKYSKTSVFFSSNYGFCQPWCQKISMEPRIISISHLKKTDGWIHMVYIYFFIGTYIANSFIKFTNALMGLLLLYIVLLSLYFIIIFIIYSLINTDLEFHIFHHNTSEFCWIIRQNSVTYYTLLTAPCLRHA